jgi:LmbE family N-acetylglucosaminyl deacetylase
MSATDYRGYVERFLELEAAGTSLPQGAPADPPARPAARPDAPCALLFSPHPDDECIAGAWPLRLRLECGWRVHNVSLTLGRHEARRPARARELDEACRVLGFETEVLLEHGFHEISRAARAADAGAWDAMAARAAGIVRERAPRAIFVPHEWDGHPTHEGAALLVADALVQLGEGFDGWVVETEYWSTLRRPNVMVEATPSLAGHLLAALVCHVGEIRRNPYHLAFPAWLRDGARRGAERVGGFGSAAGNVRLAEVYARRRWTGGRAQPAPDGRLILAGDDPSAPLPETT